MYQIYGNQKRFNLNEDMNLFVSNIIKDTNDINITLKQKNII